jgi:hypothetical protein
LADNNTHRVGILGHIGSPFIEHKSMPDLYRYILLQSVREREEGLNRRAHLPMMSPILYNIARLEREWIQRRCDINLVCRADPITGAFNDAKCDTG